MVVAGIWDHYDGWKGAMEGLKEAVREQRGGQSSREECRRGTGCACWARKWMEVDGGRKIIAID